ncbi:MAG: DEAD/DEAH box helicase family protein [bacterium]
MENNGSLRVVVDNRLRFAAADVPGWVIDALKEQFTHVNPEYGKLQALGYWAGKVPRFYQTWQLRGGEMSVPRGGARKLRALLEEAGVRFHYDVRVCDGTTHAFPPHNFPDGGKLSAFQVAAVDDLIAKQNCVVRSPTGSGKTSMAIAAISKIGRTALVMVWTGALLKQWVERIEQELRIPRREVGVVGLGRKFALKPITVAMQQSVYSIFQKGEMEAQQLIGYFGVLVCDELQRFAARTFIGAVDPFRCRYRLGFSADETRADNKEFLIYDEFGEVAVDIERDGLVDMGFILDVDVRVVPSEFAADWYHDEFLEDGTPNPNLHNHKVLLDQMCADPVRNELVARVVKMAADEGGVMVFSHRVDHCQLIDQACVKQEIKSGLMLGGAEWSHAFDETKAGLKGGTLRVGIGTFQAIGQAIDVPAVSRGVMATPVNNNRQMFGQVRGRMCRANRAGSTSAVLYYVWDHRIFGLKTLRNLMQWNNNVSVLAGDGWTSAKQYVEDAQRAARLFG